MTSAPASRCPLPPCPRGPLPTLRARTFLGRGPQQLPSTIPRNPNIIYKSPESASRTRALLDPVSSGDGGSGRAQPWFCSHPVGVAQPCNDWASGLCRARGTRRWRVWPGLLFALCNLSWAPEQTTSCVIETRPTRARGQGGLDATGQTAGTGSRWPLWCLRVPCSPVSPALWVVSSGLAGMSHRMA